jgi:hypothetical protein
MNNTIMMKNTNLWNDEDIESKVEEKSLNNLQVNV